MESLSSDRPRLGAHRPPALIAALGVATLAMAVAACSDDGGPASVAAPSVDAPAEGSTPTPTAVAVEVGEAWTRPTPGGTDRNAVYAEFTAATDDEVVGASVDSSVAGTVELHETMMDSPTGDTANSMDMDMDMNTNTAWATEGGMASMSPVAAVTLPAGETVMFEPGGYHVMLVDIATPLVEGDTVDVTFMFRDGGEVTVPVVVGDGPP
ncbi:hypothetical protein BH24ACT5_BH24ACT5_24370 [soil metagenome]